VISAKTIPSRRATLLRAWLEPATSMSTEPGVKRPTTDRCGFRPRSRRAGRLTVTANGSTNPPGDGLGWTLRRGDSLPSTMAAGCRLAATGAGLPDPIGRGLGTRPPWWRGLEGRALASALVLASVADSAGARSVGVSHSFRGMARAGVISGTSTSATRALRTSTTSPTTITITGMAAVLTAGTGLGCLATLPLAA